MPTFSKPSTPAFSIYVPQPKKVNVEFIYNYYVYDESTNESLTIPENLKKKTMGQVDSNIKDFSTRIPRYNLIKWEHPQTFNFFSQNNLISNNIEKIVSEDNFSSSKFVSYPFSSLKNVENAYQEINNQINESGISQAGIIDNYVSNLVSSYAETSDESNLKDIRKQIINAVGSLERLADRPSSTLGIEFYSKDGLKKNNSGFDSLVSESPTLHIKINSLVLPDIFCSSSIFNQDILNINSNYKSGINSSTSLDTEMPYISLGNKIENYENIAGTTSIIGYLIERYELTKNGFIKNKVIPIDSCLINSYIDYEIKYSSTYYYSVKTVAKVEVPAYDDVHSEIRNVTYCFSSNPVSKSVVCEEMTPPPYPVDINFVWDYKEKKLNIVWGMPVNSQRDIKQFQVFRRNSVNEPFELIRQKCFDYSIKKYTTGEVIDGNSSNMSQENVLFVDYVKSKSLSYIDADFSIDVENLISSKFIYTVSSIDAHGMISNYGSQFEVTFDFFKNKIVKRLISSANAPRQYPNMYINIDLFKDVIKTSGKDSKKMKIYFMPEYFKISYNNGVIQDLVSTKQKNSFYTMQFINLQNQKSDSLKIIVNDPQGLTNEF